MIIEIERVEMPFNMEKCTWNSIMEFQFHSKISPWNGIGKLQVVLT
jgi:hypothetical protein